MSSWRVIPAGFGSESPLEDRSYVGGSFSEESDRVARFSASPNA